MCSQFVAIAIYLVINDQTSMLNLPAGSLQSGKVYQFSVIVKKNTSIKSSTTSVEVEVLTGDKPAVTLDSDLDKYSSNAKLILFGSVNGTDREIMYTLSCEEVDLTIHSLTFIFN